ncbi:MAG: mannose-1-phosphate guanylyltransferase [Saprospirales bacterium]|nr:mannose-1-phosphate guanylyltransferase [Saprospirales bacterium]|tara:strand:- start:5845 stop:6954 length:1110 start_codon:yes stop_codon:yes gene_type:complete
MANQPYIVIMAGGLGSRFWPMSRQKRPKQFLDVLDCGQSMLATTIERFLSITVPKNILIVTHADYLQQVKEVCPMIGDGNILLEPVRRNTAPCVAFASAVIYAKDPKARIVVAPSDHWVADSKAFETAIQSGIDHLEHANDLITLGIQPQNPNTGYGYIQYDSADKEVHLNRSVFDVRAFTEKPDKETAKRFLSTGEFLWNSGLFLWRAKDIKAALASHLSEVHDAFFKEIKSWLNVNTYAINYGVLRRIYAQCANISIDYGIMEKAGNVRVIPSAFGWSDVGTWKSLYALSEQDYMGNVALGDLVKMYDSRDNLVVQTKKGKVVILNGLKKLLIVDTEDALVVSKIDREQEFRQIVNDLKGEGLSKFL